MTSPNTFKDKALILLTGICCAAPFLYICYLVNKYAVNVPFWDDWAPIPISPWNENHLVTRMIMCIIYSCDSLGMKGNGGLISRNTALTLPMYIKNEQEIFFENL